MANQKPFTLVLGEAPESDEDIEENDAFSTPSNPCSEKLEKSVPGSAVVGEPAESDEEIEVHTTSSSVDESESKQKKLAVQISKIQTAALKKLREENRSLYEGLTSFKRQILNSTTFELSNINQQLLKSQIELQQTLNNTRQVKNNLIEFKKKLDDIIFADYIPRINITVPANII